MGICTPMRKYGSEIDYGRASAKDALIVFRHELPPYTESSGSDTKQELHAVFAVDDMDQRSFP